jgi:ubiquitin
MSRDFAIELTNLEEQESLIGGSGSRQDSHASTKAASWEEADKRKKRRGSEASGGSWSLNAMYCVVSLGSIAMCIGTLFAMTSVFVYWGPGSYMGLYKEPPYPMPDAVTVKHAQCEFNGMPYGDARQQKVTNTSEYLPSFDTGSASQMPRKWDIVPYDSECTKTQQLDSNSCVEFKNKDVACLPALLLLGFEKCTTTEMNMWLSYHPNIVSKWEEIRYLNHANVTSEGETDWYHYLKRLPKIPGGAKNVGKYFVVDKSPDNVLAAKTARVSAALLPNARFVVMLRNPTHRAYSMFAMYTRIYQWDIKAITTSYIVKHTETGSVRYSQFSGPGGSVVPVEKRPSKYAGAGFTGEWKYIAFPPSPQDFHSYVNYSMFMFKGRTKIGPSNWLPVLTNRQGRILFQGIYHDIIQQWLPYFSKKQIIAIPMENLWTENVIENFNLLQKSLGLPVYDYKKVTSYDRTTKKYSLKSSGADAMKLAFNTGDGVEPMLRETELILDEAYCESNRKLRKLLGGAPLKGYSCAED